jgi:hypothetical protein
MSRSFYPSDEYDSLDLERGRKARGRRRESGRWLAKRWRRDDDDDDLPPSPVAVRLPDPLRPLAGAAA